MRKAVSLLLVVIMAAFSLAGCGNTDKQAANGKAKHLNVGVYWFGETMDPGHGEDGICPAAGRKVGKCQSDDLEIPDPKGCEVP